MKCAAPIAFGIGGVLGAGVAWGVLSSRTDADATQEPRGKIEVDEYFYPDGTLKLRETWRGRNWGEPEANNGFAAYSPDDPGCVQGTLVSQEWFTPAGDLMAKRGEGRYGFFLDERGAIKVMMLFQDEGEYLADGPALRFDPPVLPTRIEYHEAERGKVRVVELKDDSSEDE